MKRWSIPKGPCAVCGSTDNIEAHHEDYRYPLDVVWLCHEHHVDLTGDRISLSKVNSLIVRAKRVSPGRMAAIMDFIAGREPIQVPSS